MGTGEIREEDFELFLVENSFRGSPENLYEPMNYIMGSAGKRVRPRLLLMAYVVFKGETDQCSRFLAMAIETFHNFSLVHDDIMDEAETRRGRITVHKKWDLNTAILAGDNLLIKSYGFILKSGTPFPDLILNEFTKMASSVCDGQQLDMNLPGMSDVTEYDYLEMIRLKTAVLPATALKIGAIAAKASSDISVLFYEFGINLGMAFQLMDDYLDIFGNTAMTGKKAGGDILTSKKTILHIFTVNRLQAAERKDYLDWFGNKAQDNQIKIEKIKEYFIKSGSDQYLIQLKEQYEKKAGIILEELGSMGLNLGQLKDIFLELSNRNS